MCSMKERVIWMSCTCESGGVTLEDGVGSCFWKNAHLHNEQALAMAVQWQCNGSAMACTMAKTVHLLNENLPS